MLHCTASCGFLYKIIMTVRRHKVLKITDVRVNLLKNSEGKLKAIASIVFDDCFVIHDIKIIQTDDDCFVVMPSRKGTDGEYRDIAHPLNTATREYIKTIILDAYKKLLEDKE